MGSILELPDGRGADGKRELVEVLQGLVDPAVTERNIRQIDWWITRAYLQGMRDFYVSDLEAGEIVIGYEDAKGEMHLRWEEVLTRLATEVGRLAQLDTSPDVRKRLNSLESLRNASLSQILLDTVSNHPSKNLLDLQFILGTCMYGTYGIADWTDQRSLLPLKQITELIPPWELLGIPAGASCPTDLRIITRSRLVPVRELEQIEGWKMPPDETLLDIVEMSPGVISGGNARFPFAEGSGSGPLADLYDKADSEVYAARSRRAKLPKKVGRTEQYTILREYWLQAPGGLVARYIATAGRAVGRDINHLAQGRQVPNPIGIARYQDIGVFYGRSFSSKLIPFAMEMEKLLKSFLQNLKDIDRFRFILSPMGMGVNAEDFSDRTDGPKLVSYSPDFTQDVRGMFMDLQPAAPSDLPGRGLQLGMDLEDRLTAQGPMLGGVAPGRLDSAEGLDVLRQAGSTHLLLTARHIASAFASYYRSTLYNIKQAIRKDPTLIGDGIDITRIDNSLAGIQINPETGRVQLKADDVPDCWSVDIGIRSDDPTRRERRRQEALMMLDRGALKPLDFHLMNYKENWGFPLGDVGTWENYVTAVLFNLILFNDGQTPGAVPGATPGDLGELFNERFDLPEVHLLAIEDFMRPAQFRLASMAVRNAFIQRLEQVKARLGGQQNLPPQMPHLDQAAQQGAALGRA